MVTVVAAIVRPAISIETQMCSRMRFMPRGETYLGSSILCIVSSWLRSLWVGARRFCSYWSSVSVRRCDLLQKILIFQFEPLHIGFHLIFNINQVAPRLFTHSRSAHCAAMSSFNQCSAAITAWTFNPSCRRLALPSCPCRIRALTSPHSLIQSRTRCTSSAGGHVGLIFHRSPTPCRIRLL